MLKPKLAELQPRIKMLTGKPRTLKDKQKANGRTLALDGATWGRLRKQVLSEQPLCPECRDQGCLIPATEVDHVDNDPSNNERSNLVALCRAHHSAKTHADMGHRVHQGCDLDGMPLDPKHPWSNTVVRLGQPLGAEAKAAPGASCRVAEASADEKSPATDAHQPPGSLRATPNRKPRP